MTVMDKDVMEAFMSEHLDEALKSDPRDEWKSSSGFNLVSLDAWMGLSRLSVVPSVHCKFIASVDIEELLHAVDCPAMPNTDVQEFYQTLENAKAMHYMFRWDVCAPVDLKGNLAKGDPHWHDEYMMPPSPDDPRFFDLAFEYPGRRMMVHQRPWIHLTIHKNYPVEYRVFVQDSEIIGVSNYYPQRSLCDWTYWRKDVDKCLVYAKRLVDTMPLPVRYPGGPHRYWPTDEKSCTLDFVRTRSGGILFLEGGPPYGAGAHPCCYPENLDQSYWPPVALDTILTDPEGK